MSRAHSLIGTVSVHLISCVGSVCNWSIWVSHSAICTAEWFFSSVSCSHTSISNRRIKSLVSSWIYIVWYVPCTWFTPEIQQTGSRNDSVYFNLHSFCAVSSSRSLHRSHETHPPASILRVSGGPAWKISTKVPICRNRWIHERHQVGINDILYGMDVESRGGEVRFQKGWVDWLVRWIMSQTVFLLAEYPKWRAIFEAGNTGKYMFQGHLCWISGGLWFFSARYEVVSIWTGRVLEMFCKFVEQWLDPKVTVYIWSPSFFFTFHMESTNPESPLPTSWEQALGHSKRPSMNVGHPLAGWPARKTKILHCLRKNTIISNKKQDDLTV